MHVFNKTLVMYFKLSKKIIWKPKRMYVFNKINCKLYILTNIKSFYD